MVHRDLKPANIFLTSDGRVKVLGFGLARLTETVRSEEETEALESTLTSDGAVLGTVGYMSPEQVRGNKADHRSDIFSLGCLNT
jgi:serine/threonine protein kinase